MTRKQRIAVHISARAAAARGDHDLARALFASVGSSYCTTPITN